jgi:hypothetical protein
MTEKKFKLIRTYTVTTDETTFTPKLEVLRLKMERRQNECPNDDFRIIDEQGNPAELADFLESELAHPVAKAKRMKEEKKEKYKKEVSKRLKQC